MLQTIFNHSSPSITLRYIGISQDEINNMYEDFVLQLNIIYIIYNKNVLKDKYGTHFWTILNKLVKMDRFGI